jgi:hypothetical protein
MFKMFESEVLRRNLDGRPTGEWCKLDKMALYYFYSSADIIRVIKSRG